jgi:carotenoid 1,2-hydratase
LTLIAFIGSVFSPYYAWARRRGAGDPYQHCSLNVALYGGRAKRWAMTERGSRRLDRSRTALAIGPSRIAWLGDCLLVEIDEVAVPVPSRVRGRVRLWPTALTGYSATLDVDGHHQWSPIAPTARVEVEMSDPALSWSGVGYCDSNEGSTPLEQTFRHWTWSRAETASGTAVLYDVIGRDGPPLSLALTFDRQGRVDDIPPPPVQRLKRTKWGLRRGTRADGEAMVMRSLEDGPFYARSVLATSIMGERVRSVHETLSLDRFAAGWVQALLPFRMPRAPW